MDMPVSDPSADRELIHHPVAAWLIAHREGRLDLAGLLAGLSQRLCEGGLPILRAVLGVRSMHPEVAGTNLMWSRGEVEIQQLSRGYAMFGSPMYVNSPIRLIHEGANVIRRRLDVGEEALEWPVLLDLKQMGASDYVCFAIEQTGPQRDWISFSTDRPGGFQPDDIALLEQLLPLVALRVELESRYEAMETLLQTYLGEAAATRVLGGAVRRGEVVPIRAAVLLSDLRGFTAAVDRLPPEQVIDYLDDYFELITRPIENAGGTVLKFIGDAVLAIFDADAGEEAACANALEAAKRSLSTARQVNPARIDLGLPAIRLGVALHFGDLAFGNVGARDRLDFTVVGPAVNEITRIEKLCKAIGRPLLVSSTFAGVLDSPQLTSVGFHPLRGLSEPQEIFGLLEEQPR